MKKATLNAKELRVNMKCLDCGLKFFMCIESKCECPKCRSTNAVIDGGENSDQE